MLVLPDMCEFVDQPGHVVYRADRVRRIVRKQRYREKESIPECDRIIFLALQFLKTRNQFDLPS